MPVRSYYLGYGRGGEKDAGEKASKRVEKWGVRDRKSFVCKCLQKLRRI
jgi:hypothetical protein